MRYHVLRNAFYSIKKRPFSILLIIVAVGLAVKLSYDIDQFFIPQTYIITENFTLASTGHKYIHTPRCKEIHSQKIVYDISGVQAVRYYLTDDMKHCLAPDGSYGFYVPCIKCKPKAPAIRDILLFESSFNKEFPVPDENDLSWESEYIRYMHNQISVYLKKHQNNIFLLFAK